MVKIVKLVYFVAKRYYITFGLWHVPSVCHLALMSFNVRMPCLVGC